MKRWLASRFNTYFGRRGYVIAKTQFHQENSIDLRLLLGERLERQRGPLSVVQIGANDGVTHDPVHHLVTSRGWKLLAVEPMPAAFARLTENYRRNPNVRCVQCAIAAEDGEIEMYTVAESAASGSSDDGLASVSLDTLRRHRRRVSDLKARIRKEKVRSLTLKSLLKEYQVDRVDMLQIDAEGFDFEIITMAFAAGITPDILAFEWVHLSQKAMWDCRCALIERGYRWSVSNFDVVAAQEKMFQEPLSGA